MFNDVFSNAGGTGECRRMVKSGNDVKEVGRGLFPALSQHLPEGLKKITKHSIKAAGLRAENRNIDFKSE
jgi:hypothetical protein